MGILFQSVYRAIKLFQWKNQMYSKYKRNNRSNLSERKTKFKQTTYLLKLSLPMYSMKFIKVWTKIKQFQMLFCLKNHFAPLAIYCSKISAPICQI